MIQAIHGCILDRDPTSLLYLLRLLYLRTPCLPVIFLCPASYTSIAIGTVTCSAPPDSHNVYSHYISRALVILRSFLQHMVESTTRVELHCFLLSTHLRSTTPLNFAVLHHVDLEKRTYPQTGRIVSRIPSHGRFSRETD